MHDPDDTRVYHSLGQTSRTSVANMPRLAAVTMAMPITFLGCGKLGSSILDGLLVSAYNQAVPMKSSIQGDGISAPEVLNNFVLTSLTACVHRQSSADTLRAKHENDSIVHVLTDANVEGASVGDVIVLGCKPTAYKELLTAEGMKDALSGQKVIINLMIGVSPQDINNAIYGPGPFSRAALEQQCAVVNCTPNTAAAVRQSMTLIYDDEDPLPGWALEKVIGLFSKVGEVKRIPHTLQDLSSTMSTLTASTAAFFALALEGVAKGAVEHGLNETTALEIAAASMRGAAELITGGTTPEGVRQRIATKGGSTAQGLEILEKMEVMEAMAQAMKKASGAASQMGDKNFWKKAGDGQTEQTTTTTTTEDKTAPVEDKA